MDLIINVNDNVVTIDGKPQHEIDCQGLVGISILRWDGISGTIEFRPSSGGYQAPNETITALGPIYQFFIDAWTIKDNGTIVPVSGLR